MENSMILLKLFLDNNQIVYTQLNQFVSFDYKNTRCIYDDNTKMCSILGKRRDYKLSYILDTIL